MAERPEVKPGQIWADNDPRSVGRTLRVVSIGKHSARCVVLTAAVDGPPSTVGKTRMIVLDRFRPVSNGYRLIKDVPREQ